MKQQKRIYYDRRSDALYLLIRSGTEEEVQEVAPGVNVELDQHGRLLGIEILNASRSLRQLMKKSRTDVARRESLRETVSILAIPGARESIKEGMREIKKGQGIPLEQFLASS